jgi:1-phosphatidylinositol-4-phosphate 5-kinase
MELDNLKPEDIYRSLDLEMNRNMVFKAGEGAGQSGSFFFFSYDNKFLIKTMTQREMDLLLSKLEFFVNYYKSRNNQTLIAKIYGVFTIKSNVFAPLRVMIMQNTAMLQNPNNHKMTFDMKGSTIKRKVRFSG